MKKTQADLMRQEGYLSAAEAAESSGVAVTTVHRWLSQGKVEGTQVGSYWYVSKDSLVEYLGPIASRAAGLSTEP